MQAKFSRFPFSSSEATAKRPLDEVVMDVVGPLKLGAAGAEYFLSIVDIYTRMTWVYVLSKKSDVAETVKTNWLPMVERQQDRLVKAIRTDRGGEFLSKDFSMWLKKNDIKHSLTMPYSPAMNGIAERANRTITETARGLLIEAGLPDYFWPDAARSACVAKNRALTHVVANKWVPYMEWIGRKLKVDMLRVLGCMCMALVPKHLRHNKLGAKAIWAVEMPGEPETLKEALESSDAEEWKKAMESELKSIEENGTWELVELPEGRKAITSKWLFKIKSDVDDKIEHYKSRLVAKGYQQKEKVDYKELFAPVVKPTTPRTLLAGATIKGWVVKQMDVTTAFLNSVLEEEIFMAQLEGLSYFRAAQQPSRPTAEPPSSRAAEPPCSRVATAPTGAPRPYLLGLCDRADGLSLFNLTSGASPALPATADSTVRSQWATRDAAARLAVRRHLPTTERAHFSQYKSAQTLYDVVVACYSSPATAALSRLMLPYLFPDLAAFPTVADLITHLRTSDTRYRAALPAEFCAKNPPPPCTSQSTT
ncbi:unnamed protein product [Closterium sp. NIES-54]